MGNRLGKFLYSICQTIALARFSILRGYMILINAFTPALPLARLLKTGRYYFFI